MASPLVSEAFGALLEPGLARVFIDQYETLPEMRSAIFGIRDIDTSYFKDASVGRFTTFTPFTGTIDYDDAVQNFEVTYRPVEYTKGFKVERKLFDDDLYGAIARLPRNLAVAANITYETEAASIFNGAFNGNGTIQKSGISMFVNNEGKSLCNSAHPLGRGTNLTQSNTDVTVLNATSVEAKRVQMAKFQDDKGNLIAVTPDLIVIPRALEQTGYEIIATSGKVDTAENNANFHYGRYKLAVWDYLTPNTVDTASSQWFMCDSIMMKDFLTWVDRIPLEFFRDKDFDTLMAKFAAYMRFAYGWSDWRWVHGSQPV